MLLLFFSGAGGPAPPLFSGTIPDISESQNTGTHQYDLSSYFGGAASYSIDPALEAGWSFDTGTAVLEIDTDALGTFGPYIITATNGAGSDDSNAFSVTITEAATEPVGGHYWPTKGKSPRKNWDEERRKKRELRELIERAAGLIEDVVESTPSVAPQAKALDAELSNLRTYASEVVPTRATLHVVQKRIDALIAKSVDNMIVQIADVLTDLIHEIAEDDDAT